MGEVVWLIEEQNVVVTDAGKPMTWLLFREVCRLDFTESRLTVEMHMPPTPRTEAKQGQAATGNIN